MTDETLIIETLRRLRHIEPSTDFLARSRHLVSATPQTHPSVLVRMRRGFAENLKFTAALALASIMIVALFGGISRLSSLIPGDSWTKENRALMTEAGRLDFDIELGTASYYDESADEVAALLQEIHDPQTKSSDTFLNETF